MSILCIDNKLRKLQKEGLLDVESVLYKRSELITKHLNLNQSPEIFMNYFSNNFGKTAIEINGARNLIKYLSQKYLLCATSNGIFSIQKIDLKLQN
ncbi:hypothetical protein [Anaerococcus porci]|uniref:hypothetical protein n=1 Tax=Anaerococcus porci TaxID=2652269 RepID=UPI0018A6C00E|nr:hypothetical protein [Anaerococcus porci]